MWLGDLLIYCGIPLIMSVMGAAIFGPAGIILGPIVLGAGLLLGRHPTR